MKGSASYAGPFLFCLEERIFVIFGTTRFIEPLVEVMHC